ncbi:YceI-like domain-containing protein [Chitinophaga niastensis]|uniref:YceI-like domain-containing protein n=1 Tax=Chitinophaga niastensis TaxID=536980 RepID=A0A2P8HU76_CHINA|nr:YceI family protein [Chitinophaga niastensis]PSL49787.1 YceI-like domain-containing protein [Chitinophaga niastensis]
MKFFLVFVGALLLGVSIYAQDVYSCRSTHLSFFSSSPLEDIEAKTDKGVSAVNKKTRDIYFKVAINTFQFRKKLMQEHFNENYLESDKFPFAEFRGKINESPELNKDGTYPVTVTGALNIHGVSKMYTAKGTITTRGNVITVSSTFNVRVADHGIKIPSLVVQNVAEVVAVTVNAAYISINN